MYLFPIIGPLSPQLDVWLEAPLKDPMWFPSGDVKPAWQVHSAGWRDSNRLKCRMKPTTASWKTVFLLVIFSTNSWWLQQSQSFRFIIFGDLLLICLGVYWHEGEKLNFIPTEFLPSSLFAESLRDIFISFDEPPSLLVENERHLDQVNLLSLKWWTDVKVHLWFTLLGTRLAYDNKSLSVIKETVGLRCGLLRNSHI